MNEQQTQCEARWQQKLNEQKIELLSQVDTLVQEKLLALLDNHPQVFVSSYPTLLKYINILILFSFYSYERLLGAEATLWAGLEVGTIASLVVLAHTISSSSVSLQSQQVRGV